MKTGIRFWRLQEVEVSLKTDKGLEDLKNAINQCGEDENLLFDFDLFDWGKEEVINEDYSGTGECLGIVIDGEITNDYRKDNCETFGYVDKGTRNWNKAFIKYLDEIINKRTYK